MAIDPSDFGASFKVFLDHMSNAAPAEEPFFRTLLSEHFGALPDKLHTLAEKIPLRDHANVQLAIESVLLDGNDNVQEFGFTGGHQFMPVSLAALASPAKGGMSGGSQFTEGPVEYLNIAIDNGKVMQCVQNGLFISKHEGQPLALLVSGAAREFHPLARITLDVMAHNREVAEHFLGELRTAMRKRNVFRGQIISLSQSQTGQQEVQFHSLPEVTREDIILPEGLLERIERQTVRFSQLSDRLRASGRHLKRGVLLHGPPGTGKTLSAMYVAKAIKDRTVLVLTGRGQGMIEQSCAMARSLQPAIVILEDVDLIAEERDRPDSCSSPLLFELLNQMDGLGDDADVLFLLTTNRPDILEPALASRPGRIDQAIEVPLPDNECRRRLLDLYCQGLQLGDVDLQNVVERTNGASAAFIRELVRKAALFAADESSDQLGHKHMDDALHELVVDGGPMTKSLLGFATDR